MQVPLNEVKDYPYTISYNFKDSIGTTYTEAITGTMSVTGCFDKPMSSYFPNLTQARMLTHQKQQQGK